LALMAAMAWLYMSTNAIKPDENGLVLRLGAYNRTAGPGLHFVLWPLERMERLPVEAENQINLGGGPGDALTLASDQNLVRKRNLIHPPLPRSDPIVSCAPPQLSSDQHTSSRAARKRLPALSTASLRHLPDTVH
jgi:hypothetical protein